MNTIIKTIFYIFLFIIVLFPPKNLFSQCNTDTIKSMYASGAKLYSTELLLNTISFIEGNAGSCAGKEYTLLFYKGLCFWRLQVIAFSKEESKKVKEYGLAAEKAFQGAEEIKGNTFELATFYALVYQLMADLGFNYGGIYGPKIGAMISLMKKEKPDDYYTLFVDAVNLVESPKFVGGNPQKGYDMLVELKKGYPDSIDIDIQTAKALLKLKRVDEAQQHIKPVVKKTSYNLLARKVERDIKKVKR